MLLGSILSGLQPVPLQNEESKQDQYIGLQTKSMLSEEEGLLQAQSAIPSPRPEENFKKMEENQEIIALLNAIEALDENLAKQIALNQNFIDKNKEFIGSGKAVVKAINCGLENLALELYTNGYSVPDAEIINAVQSGKDNLALEIIRKQIHKNEFRELVLWYLAYKDSELALDEFLNQNQDLRIYAIGGIKNQEERKKIYSDPTLVSISLWQSISAGLDNVACYLLMLSPASLTISSFNEAIQKCCMGVLKRLWTGDVYQSNISLIKRRKKKSAIWNSLKNQAVTVEERKILSKGLRLSKIIDCLAANNKLHEMKDLVSWPGAANDDGVIQKLINLRQEEIAKEAANKCTIASAKDFIVAWDAEYYDICVLCLKSEGAIKQLEIIEIQEKLVSLLTKGETCLPAIKMLSRIPSISWKYSLTKDLCLNIQNIAKRNNEIIFCPAPLLFCALAAEFLSILGRSSLQYENRCFSAAETIKDLGVCIEESIKDENELRFFLLQADTLDRTALNIITVNGFTNMLESDEIGTIITKLWIGPNKNYGLIGASGLWTSLKSPSGSDDAMAFSRSMDKTKPYLFHYIQWIDSCSLRFYSQALSTICLVIIYQILIYSAIQADAFSDVASDPTSEVFLRIAQFWIGGILLEHILHFLFSFKTGRVYEMGFKVWLDICMFIDMILIMIGFQNYYAGEGNKLNYIDPALCNACLHSIMMILIWIRFMSILITTKTFGPFLKMLMLMIGRIINFFVVYFCLIVCSAAVFTALFNESNPNYVSFSISIRSLMAAALGTYDFYAFTKHIALGGVLLSIYLFLSLVLLLNLLIAILFNVFSTLITQAENKHRLTLSSYYEKYIWDEKYGVLILLPSPLNYLTLLLSPLVLLTRKPIKYNNILCRILFVSYGIIMFSIFLSISVVMIPIVYIKGFAIYGKTGREFKEKRQVKIFSSQGEDIPIKDIERSKISKFSKSKTLAWIFIGIPWLIWSVMKDCFYFWALMYANPESIVEENEKAKIDMIINHSAIKSIQKTLKRIKSPDISVALFVEKWLPIDREIQISTSLREDMRKQLAFEYFIQYANTSSDQTINVPRMRRLLPEKPNYLYSEDYLIRTRHINIPALLKGIKKYQRQIGSFFSASSHSDKNNNEEGEQNLDIEDIENLQKMISELEVKFSKTLIDCSSLRTTMEEQSKILRRPERKKTTLIVKDIL